jgi:hypothetical protein
LSEDVKITVYLEPVDGGVMETLQNFNAEVQKVTTSINVYGKNAEQITVPLKAVGDQQEKTNRTIRSALSPVRVASRDVWTLAYAFRRLNTTVFGNNETIGRLVNTLIALGAVLRIVAVMESVVTNFKAMKGAVAALTGVYKFFNAELSMTAFWFGLITAGIATAAGLAGWAIVQSQAPKSYQTGGTVPSTGIYMLHKGEVVTPAGGPDYSQINIYVQTGAINTKGDMESLFSEMAVKLARERRRRGV